MRERPLFWGIPKKHSDDDAHIRLHINDEYLFVIPNEQCASTVGGQDSANLDRHHIVLHIHSVLRYDEKTSLPRTPGLGVLPSGGATLPGSEISQLVALKLC